MTYGAFYDPLKKSDKNTCIKYQKVIICAVIMIFEIN